MLDKIQFRKLENGYTVKYHVAVIEEMAGKGPSGFSGEIFVTNEAELHQCVAMLITKYLKTTARSVDAKPSG